MLNYNNRCHFKIMRILHLPLFIRKSVSGKRMKFLSTLVAAFFGMAISTAASSQTISTGESYYIWGITESVRVNVQELDSAASQARVEYPNGKMRWVSISRLQTKEEPTNRDMGIVALILHHAICTVKECSKRDSATALSTTPPQPEKIPAQTEEPPPTPQAREIPLPSFETIAFPPKDYTYTPPGCYLGFGGKNLPYFIFGGQKFEYGIQIDDVDLNMPAGLANLLSGDIIWGIDDKLVSNMEFLKSHINSLQTCQTHKIRLIRDQQILEATVTTAPK